MAAVQGKEGFRRFMADLPGQIEAKLLRGAARAAMTVVKDEAAQRVTSREVGEALTIKPPKTDGGRVTVKLTVNGQWPHSVGIWLEYGTAPHLISVDPSQSAGRSVGRINRLAKEGGIAHSLVIGGKFVGATVMHPGARPHPFLRVSLDTKGAEAMAAAQSYINARVKPAGITGDVEPEGDSA